MLQRPSPDVLTYLDRASRARELHDAATGKAERDFHLRMEASWMRLAASAAFVERVDLFLHTRERNLRPASICPDCGTIAVLRTVAADGGRFIYTFECASCGKTEERRTAGPDAMSPVRQQTSPHDGAKS